jgi:ActR/RegA family two-component response regulator
MVAGNRGNTALVVLLAIVLVGAGAWLLRDHIPGLGAGEPVEVSPEAAASAQAKLDRLRDDGDTVRLNDVEAPRHRRHGPHPGSRRRGAGSAASSASSSSTRGTRSAPPPARASASPKPYPEFRPDLTFMDVKMARMDGLEALSPSASGPGGVVVMISGHGTIETAVEATRRGAFDFLEKPLDTDRHPAGAAQRLQQRGLLEENARLRGEVESRHEIVGRSFAIRQVLERGEGGAHRRARADHRRERHRQGAGGARHPPALAARGPSRSSRSTAPRSPGAHRVRALRPHEGLLHGRHGGPAGKFELADGGTLFLDEVGDMSLAAQAKVLRALQEGIVTRVGGRKAHPGGRAGARRDQQGAPGGDPRGPVPRGPVPPAQRDPAARAAAARAARGHPDAGAALRETGAREANLKPQARSPTRRSTGCSGWTGRATCASCATPWSGC